MTLKCDRVPGHWGMCRAWSDNAWRWWHGVHAEPYTGEGLATIHERGAMLAYGAKLAEKVRAIREPGPGFSGSYHEGYHSAIRKVLAILEGRA